MITASRTAAELRDACVAGELTPYDSVEQSLAWARDVGAGGEHLNIFTAVRADLAERDAEDAATRFDGAETGLLHGVTIAVKDNIATHGLPTTCASAMLDGYVSPFQATAVERMRSAGALLLGKTNMDEFAMGSSTESSIYGPTRNPVSPRHVPGGSSGGSAAAVAAGIVRIALGSDTGGSARQPAAFCGVVGVKPTYGRVSRHGLVGFAPSLDTVGIFGGCVDDTAIALSVIAGSDGLDATCSDRPVENYRLGADAPLTGLVIGRPAEYFPQTLDDGIRERCDDLFARLGTLGATVREVSLPHTRHAVAAYHVLASAEASSNLARFDGMRFGVRQPAASLRATYEATRAHGFGPEVRRRIILGMHVLSAEHRERLHRQARLLRALIAEDFRSAFASGLDLLLTPTTPTPAFLIGEEREAAEMHASDRFTCPSSLAGLPAMSLPIGRVGGLPVAAQLIAPHFAEVRMLAAAYAIERALGGEAHR